MNSQTKTNPETQVPYDVKHLHDLLEQQKIAYLRHPVPTAKERIDRLARLKRVLVKYQDQIAEAINLDYGNRAIMETKIGELLTCLEQIKYYSKNLTGWMKPSKRHISVLHQPAKVGYNINQWVLLALLHLGTTHYYFPLAHSSVLWRLVTMP